MEKPNTLFLYLSSALIGALGGVVANTMEWLT